MPASCSQERGSQALGGLDPPAGGGQVGGLAFGLALALPWWTGCAGTKKIPGSGT